ncbi:MAG: rRNA (guanosine-2-O-)-methyltransferase RlmB, partial [Planctomycetota bacterium]
MKKPSGKHPGRRPTGSATSKTLRPAAAVGERRTAARSGPRSEAVRRHQATSEETYHGLRACEALFERRPDAIVRVYLTAAKKPRFAKLLAWCAANHKGFQIVPEESLRRISGATHHEGVAILAKAIRRKSLVDLLALVEKGRCTGPILYLDGVENPHNLGSILRTAAHFGVMAVVGKAGELPPLSPAAVRVAEGAAEIVPVCDLAEPAADLRRLAAAGFAIVAASSHKGTAPADAPLAGRSVIVLGSEGRGVSPSVARVATAQVCIPGTNAVESLNVSVAAGILLAESWRQRG